MKVIKEGLVLVKDSMSGQPQTYALGGKFAGDNIIDTDGSFSFYARLDETTNKIFIECATKNAGIPTEQIVCCLQDSGLDWEHRVKIVEEMNV